MRTTRTIKNPASRQARAHLVAVCALSASSVDYLILQMLSSMSPTRFARNVTSSSSCLLAFWISASVAARANVTFTGADDDGITNANNEDSDRGDCRRGSGSGNLGKQC